MITLTQDDLNRIMASLNEMPFKHAAPLVAFFQAKVAALQQSAAAKSED